MCLHVRDVCACMSESVCLLKISPEKKLNEHAFHKLSVCLHGRRRRHHHRRPIDWLDDLTV